MKKVILMLALICAVVSANAQIATENSKLFDNWSVGVAVGETTPLDFNSVFPLNTTVGLNLRKDLTPVVGIQAEYTVWLNDNHFNDSKTLVKGGNLGLNGIINWSNWVLGYKGTPRVFEISSVTGIGWLHKYDLGCNHLTAKTGLDLTWKLGKRKAHSLVLTPAVYWNLNETGGMRFDKRYAQLAVSVGYVYHFKTSNGTHSFKIHDVGALTNEIDDLQGQLGKANEDVKALKGMLKRCNEANKALLAKVEKTTTTVNATTVVTEGKWVVQFAKNSTELTDEAKAELDKVATNKTVTIVGSASPEGTANYNQKLSERRAAVVADYLTQKGVKVNTVSGLGANTDASNRIAIVTVE